MESRDGVVVEEFVKDEWWEVGAEVGGVVDYVAGDLVWGKALGGGRWC